MPQYKLLCVGASGNAYKVALYLNCAGLDWEPVGVDFAGGQTRDAQWRAETNEMGEVPVLEVADRRLSQSGAILMWLAETTGHFAVTEDERFEALRWILFDNHKFTGNFAVHRLAYAFLPEAPDPSLLAFLRARADAALSIVDRHLSDRAFVLGDRLTIVDLSMVGYLYYPSSETGFDLAATYPSIQRWLMRVSKQPGWKPPYELMPVGASLPLRSHAS